MTTGVSRLICAVFAVAVFAAPANAGTLTSPAGDVATFTAAAGEFNNLVVEHIGPDYSYGIRFRDSVPITVVAGGWCNTVTATEARCFAEQVNAYLGDLNDTFTGANFNSIPFSYDHLGVDGGSGDDSLTGGPGNVFGDGQILIGGEGGDFISGGGGTDTLQGGPGGDVLDGKGSNDTLEGGDGADTLRGDTGDDTLRGGADFDTYTGGPGNDRLENSADPDGFAGGDGFDTVDYTGSTSFDPRLGLLGVVVTIDDVANDGNGEIDDGFFDPGPIDNVQSDIEAVVGTAGTDQLNGGTAALDQSFTGAGGDDTFTGGRRSRHARRICRREPDPDGVDARRPRVGRLHRHRSRLAEGRRFGKRHRRVSVSRHGDALRRLRRRYAPRRPEQRQPQWLG